MADSLPNTGSEPKLANFFSYTDPEHKPINIPDSHHDFLCPDDVTMIPTSPEGLPNAEAFSSSQKAAAGIVASLFGHPRLAKLLSKGTRDRDTNVVHSLRDRKSPKDT